jgi:hypothetical protein
MTKFNVTSNSDTIKLDVKPVEQKLNVTKVEYAVSLARTGGQGSPGGTTIGGLPIAIEDISEGDLLTVNSQRWINVKRTNITDGGNF